MYAKALHRDLRAEYERLLAHPGLLSARSDIALLRVRLNQLAGRLDTGESGRRWGDVRTAFTEFRQASNAGDSGRMIAALNRLDALVTGAGDVEGAYADLAALIERVSTIAAREHRMIVEERLTVSAEDVRVLVASIADAVLTHVQDPAARLAIVERIQALSVLNNEELATVAGRTLHTHTTVNPTDADSEL